MLRILRYLALLLDTAFVDPFRAKEHYPNRLSMTWGDFWRLTK